MPGRLTITDIARLAGVSASTVSRVLNHKLDVDPRTRERILALIEEQGFRPNLAAAGLASGQNKLIGLLMPSLTWPLVTDLLRGVADAVETTQYELLLYAGKDEPARRDRSELIDRLLATHLTAGILAVFPGPSESQRLAELHRQGFPIVVIDDQQQQIPPWVRVDNITGAYLAVRHLVELGHRRIAHIQGPLAELSARDRYQGYCQALLEAKITPDPTLLLEGDFMPQSGFACASRLFELPLEQRPTAIFAATDQMAYGVISAAEHYGISIPRDIALVGFDDDSPSSYIRPALTTVRQPNFELGRQGILLLLSLLDSLADSMQKDLSLVERRAPVPSTRVELPSTLVVRDSCGAQYSIPSSYS
jgi:LacI family transcriptional regulator